MANPTVGLTLRVAPGVHARLKSIARRERRSLTGQILHIIEAAVACEKNESFAPSADESLSAATPAQHA
ncbi:hypothetical protein HB662_19780 [Roseomonas frigidaquae]|uniref:Toxin-antitoxin system HicB family antitoxin n=1 Tax=Falsiroseomonas frigidaquae TaxID=487318 RepID=A0ABX1F3V3_9PROT|nr:hypothetical protein [Falsiroseomonas frigidaquae]NKE47030.1 hypothetical protein [Falsiroseomonas frigidaquae]